MAGISSKAAGGLENKKKYNGIEETRDLDLNQYDAFFRNLDPQLGRWWQVDPKIEEMEGWSPYNSMFDNPISKSDPLGDFAEYRNEQGTKVADDGVKDNRVFVIKTTKTTTQLYGSRNTPEKGNSNPISIKEAKETENQLRQGNFTGSHMGNLVEVAPVSTMKEMIKEVSKDDGTGGTKPNNNREYGGFLFRGHVVPNRPGPVMDPTGGENASTSSQLKTTFHSHPSGTKKMKLPDGSPATATWAQPPSRTDINTARGTEYVFGMGSKKIYIYNETGVVATIPQASFK